jgi:hypothetical protein
MTGRSLVTTAGAALAVAAFAVAIGPILSIGHHAAPPPTPTTTTSDTAAVGAVAEATAGADLRCPTTSDQQPSPTRRHADCGILHINRRQTTCLTATQCTVDLIGTLSTNGLAVPVALTVTVTRAAERWRVVEVAS